MSTNAAAYWVPAFAGTTAYCVAASLRPLHPQHRLSDDVALDLVGAAVDRDLAVVEIARRDLGGPVHRFVAAVVAVLVEGCCERADHFHQQLGGGLLNFRAFYLQHRRGGVRL